MLREGGQERGQKGPGIRGHFVTYAGPCVTNGERAETKTIEGA